jgi:hypothetical protein
MIRIPDIVLQFHMYQLDYHAAFGQVLLTDHVPLPGGIKDFAKDLQKSLSAQSRTSQPVKKRWSFEHSGSLECLHVEHKSKKVFSVVHKVHNEEMIGFEDNKGNQGIIIVRTGSLVNAWVDFYP